jgi:hypothetical protein
MLKVLRSNDGRSPAIELRREAAILNRLGRTASVTAAPPPVDGEWAVLSSEWIDGVPANEAQRDVMMPLRIARELLRVNARGVMHQDLNLGNILITSGGRPQLIDFGTATVAGWPRAFVGDFFGLPRHAYRGNSLRHTLAVLWPTMAAARTRFRAHREGVGPENFRRVDRLTEPHVPVDDAAALERLAQAWQSRRVTPVHGLSVGSLVLRGRASWLPVWRKLKARTDFAGRHVLDLGSDGLLGIFALAEGAASATTLLTDGHYEPEPLELDRAFGVDPDSHLYSANLPEQAGFDLVISVGPRAHAAMDRLLPRLGFAERLVEAGPPVP